MIFEMVMALVMAVTAVVESKVKVTMTTLEAIKSFVTFTDGGDQNGYRVVRGEKRQQEFG